MNLPQRTSTTGFSTARYNMVDCQLRPNKVRDERILTAMETLPREVFVPQGLAGIAYIDKDLEVAPGRFLLEPVTIARLIQELSIGPTDHVLDIAVATGYSSAILASLAKDVTAIEPDISLHKIATDNMKSLNLTNVGVEIASMTQGLASRGPFNAILINGSVDYIPDSLLDQLDEGGRLVAVVRHYGPAMTAHTGDARLFEKVRGIVSSRSVFDANVKPLEAFAAPKTFVF